MVFSFCVLSKIVKCKKKQKGIPIEPVGIQKLEDKDIPGWKIHHTDTVTSKLGYRLPAYWHIFILSSSK